MNINVLVSGGLYDTAAGFSAFNFCRAALAAGHQLTQIFFYQAGVTQANAFSAPLADEFDAPLRWSELAEQHGLDLVVCVAAGERRGVITAEQQAELNKPAHNLASRFEVEGLASFHAASAEADRTVTFK